MFLKIKKRKDEIFHENFVYFEKVVFVRINQKGGSALPELPKFAPKTRPAFTPLLKL